MIGTMIEPVLDGMGYDLVRVQLGGGQDPCLQIMVERTDRAEMTVDDCATISRQISKLLDEEDPISDAYTLEVSSPGIDRPLVGLGDYDRFAGFDARVESREAVLGRKRFKGVLGGTDGNEILIEVGNLCGSISQYSPRQAVVDRRTDRGKPKGAHLKT